MHVEIIQTDELGDRTYVVHDGTVAVVVDPQRDIDRVEGVLQNAGVAVALVLETHIHNDYVTGGHHLSRRADARYALNAADPVAFDRVPVRDGDMLEAGSLRIRVRATPGHTDTHLAYVVTDSAAPAEPPAVFTGGSLLYGSVGRTDLVDPVRTEELTRAQYRSVHRLVEGLPDAAQIYPTHGFGSFCSSGSTSGRDTGTLGIERRSNDAFTAPDERTFVADLVAALTAYPAYYAHMAPRNLGGPEPADLSAPETVEAGELHRRIDAGEWVVDLRDRVFYAADHLAGTVGIALGTQFATYLGWLAPWESPITLIGDSPAQVAAAQRQMVRIGIDRPAGAATGDLDALTAAGRERRTYPRVGFAALRRVGPDAVLLDVRRDDERVAGHIAHSVHIPLHHLLSCLDELPHGTVWVHCASGFRASIAASLLDRAGRDVTLIDDEYGRAVALGLSLN
ncbi:rhodanese-like domain-containing protein [Streptomyces sp. NPDC091217]|uniref:MBL fold metallo-hydrolase n=1 Tax=Streptomyces sp. NPDC091217 TaxID=3365975 RepID=UPI003811F5C6